MEEGKKIDTIDTDKIEEVAGGHGQFEDREDGYTEYWFVCSYCLGYKELIQVIPPNATMTYEGTFVCPKCGWKQNFKLIARNGEIRADSWAPGSR